MNFVVKHECQNQWRILIETRGCYGIPKAFYIYNIRHNISISFIGKVDLKYPNGCEFKTHAIFFLHITLVFVHILFKKTCLWGNRNPIAAFIQI